MLTLLTIITFIKHLIIGFSIIPLLQLLISSFQLTFIACSSWYLSTHIFISNNFFDSVSCCRLCLYLSPDKLPIPSFFSLSSPPAFPSASSWLSSIFNTLPFSLITATNIHFLPVSYSNCPSFHKQNSMLLQTTLSIHL